MIWYICRLRDVLGKEDIIRYDQVMENILVDLQYRVRPDLSLLSH